MNALFDSAGTNACELAATALVVHSPSLSRDLHIAARSWWDTFCNALDRAEEEFWREHDRAEYEDRPEDDLRFNSDDRRED